MSMVNHKQLSQREAMSKKKGSHVVVKTGFPLKSESDVVDKHEFDLRSQPQNPVSIYSHQASRAVAQKIKSLQSGAQSTDVQEMNALLLNHLSADPQEQPGDGLQKTLLQPKNAVDTAGMTPVSTTQVLNKKPTPAEQEDQIGDNLQIPKLARNGLQANSHLQNPAY